MQGGEACPSYLDRAASAVATHRKGFDLRPIEHAEPGQEPIRGKRSDLTSAFPEGSVSRVTGQLPSPDAA
jgi:hypothetical protein